MPWPMTEPATEPAIDELIMPIMLGAWPWACGAIGGGAVCTAHEEPDRARASGSRGVVSARA